MNNTQGHIALKIVGGSPLYGSVRIGGAKNASYKLMIASLLADSESRILNFSQISDVEDVKNIIISLGGEVREVGERTLLIDPTKVHSFEFNPDLGKKGRFSTVFLGPLLSRFGEARVPAPGGDAIGKRPLERHFDGLKKLGVTLTQEGNVYMASTTGLKGTNYRFEKNTHTGTETLLLAAVKAKGKTVLENCALEPEIDDLIIFLNAMGANIERKPNRVIEIEGVEHLHGADHQILPDRNEAVSYACAAIASKGDVIIENARASDLTAFLNKLEEIGAGYEVSQHGVRFFYDKPLKATTVTTQIEPGFMTDWQPLWATLATQCQGESIIHETVMQNRFQYVEALQNMGAHIEYFSPQIDSPNQLYNFNLSDDTSNAYHAIRIVGPTQLRGGEFQVVDLRHGATLIIAALTARGETLLHGVEQIERGYENIDGRLRQLGAKIEKVTV